MQSGVPGTVSNVSTGNRRRTFVFLVDPETQRRQLNEIEEPYKEKKREREDFIKPYLYRPLQRQGVSESPGRRQKRVSSPADVVP